MGSQGGVRRKKDFVGWISSKLGLESRIKTTIKA